MYPAISALLLALVLCGCGGYALPSVQERTAEVGLLLRRDYTDDPGRSRVIRHADLQLQYKGEYIGIREMRKHVSWYSTGYPESARFRAQINCMEDMESLKKACRSVFLGDRQQGETTATGI